VQNCIVNAKLPMTITIVMMLSLIGSLVVVFANLPSADAHKPLRSGNNYQIESATVIPDPRVSWAIYQQLPESGREYYRFNASEGERFYMQMTIPNLKKYEAFYPSIAIVGKGLHDVKIDAVNNSVIRKVDISALGLGGIQSNGKDAIILDYDRSGSSTIFFEPFTQTSYLIRQELMINHLPSSGTYELIVFDASPGNEVGGKYVLAVGETESFSMVDFFTTLPAAWFQTKLYFEDYVSIALAIFVILCILAVPAILLVRRRRLKAKDHAIRSY
jgi:hypothetical protein